MQFGGQPRSLDMRIKLVYFIDILVMITNYVYISMGSEPKFVMFNCYNALVFRHCNRYATRFI